MRNRRVRQHPLQVRLGEGRHIADRHRDDGHGLEERAPVGGQRRQPLEEDPEQHREGRRAGSDG